MKEYKVIEESTITGLNNSLHDVTQERYEVQQMMERTKFTGSSESKTIVVLLVREKIL